jgi:hypothetical protein
MNFGVSYQPNVDVSLAKLQQDKLPLQNKPRDPPNYAFENLNYNGLEVFVSQVPLIYLYLDVQSKELIRSPCTFSTGLI